MESCVSYPENSISKLFFSHNKRYQTAESSKHKLERFNWKSQGISNNNLNSYFRKRKFSLESGMLFLVLS